MLFYCLLRQRVKVEKDRIVVIGSPADWIFVAVGLLISSVALISLIAIWIMLLGDYIRGIAVDRELLSYVPWLLVVVAAGFFAAIHNDWHSAHTLIIDARGIREKTILPIRRNRSYKWSEVNEWGIFYLGMIRTTNQNFALYFSDKTLPTIENGQRKQLDRKTVKFFFFISAYDEIIDIVLPYCEAHAPVNPYTPTVPTGERHKR